MKGDLLKKIIFMAALLGATFAWKISNIGAQGARPQFVITWRAENYVPPDFPGKALPTPGSPVSVSFELLSPTTGKVVDLSRQPVYWYLDDNLISNDAGVQSLTFVVPNQSADTMSLRIDLPSLQSVPLSETVAIPVVEPLAVIEAPFPESTFSTVSPVLKAAAYFFNVRRMSDLAIQWSVNGQTPSSAENPNALSVNLGPNTLSGSNLSVGLIIQNPKNQSEAASANANLIFAK